MKSPPARRRRRLGPGLAVVLVSMAALACTAGTTKPETPAAVRPADCRTSGCPLGETCVTNTGCGAPWTCQGCSMAYLSEAREYCGCDGRTIQTRELGCQTFAFAHAGACKAAP